MPKKKKTALVIVLLILLISGYFGYKAVNLYLYNISSLTIENYNDFINSLRIKNTMKIDQVIIPDEDYLSFNDIKVKNYFKDFKKLEYPESTDEFIKYALYDENDELMASFWIGSSNTYVQMLKSEMTFYGTDDKRFLKIDRVKFLKSNNIENDIDLIKFLEKNKKANSNIFTSVKKMKGNYALQFFASIAFPIGEGITLIDGDYQGYIFNMKSNIRECNILYNDKRYVFTFIKTDYFTDDYINEILNTVVIDKK